MGKEPPVRINPQLLEKIKESLSSVLPITAIVLALSITIVPLTPGALVLFLFGSLMLIVGIFTVAAGVGLFLVVALLRILLKIPLSRLLVGFYLVVFTLALFAPKGFIPVSFDSGGVTTGPITVPFIMALGVGMASVRSDKNSTIDSFGLVALCSIGPVLSVLLLGICYAPESPSAPCSCSSS